MKISDIMTEKVITVTKDDTVEKCANLLATHTLSGLPVVDDAGYVKGIVTEGDLIKHNTAVQVPAFIEILGGIIFLDNPNTFFENVEKSMGHFVENVMTEEVITINPEEDIEKAARILVRHQITRLPVTDDEGKLMGIVARRDIMNHLFDHE